MSLHEAFQLGNAPAEAAQAGGYTPSVWVGPIIAGTVYEVGWFAADLAQMVRDQQAGLGSDLEKIDPGSETEQTFIVVLGDNVFDSARKGNSGKFAYYYFDKNKAETVCRLLDIIEPFIYDGKEIKRKPNQVWRLETTVSECLTLTAKQKAEFQSESMAWDTMVKVSGKAFHPYHLMALPSAIKAYAELVGLTVPDLNMINELSGPTDEIIITEELKNRLIGGEDVSLEESIGWQDRVALWSALGESEPRAFGWTEECWNQLNTGLPYPDQGKLKLTDSVNLGAALYTMRSNWTGPTYAAVLSVPDPDPGRMYESPKGSGNFKSPKVAVVRAFYADRDVALAAVAEMDIEVDTASTGSVDTTGLAIPEVYQGDAELWLGQVKAQVAKHLAGVANMPEALKAVKVKTFIDSPAGQGVLTGELLATADEFTAAVMSL